jgi:glycosyltransferase involved in cell wall biosynthesis
MPGPVLINAANVTAAGPKALVLSLLPELFRHFDNNCIVVVPDDPSYKLATAGQDIVYSPASRLLKAVHRTWEIYHLLPRLVRSSSARVCLTLGDTGPISLRCPHVVFLHHPPLLYEDSAYGDVVALELMKTRIKRSFFAKSVERASEILVQTPIVRARVIQRYDLAPDRVRIIPMAIPDYSRDPMSDDAADVVPPPRKPLNLLFLSAYYPHKGHRLLPAIAELLRQRGLTERVHIFTTLAGDSRAERRLLSSLRSEQDIVTNLGRVTGQAGRRLLTAMDALFLPSLMETYGFPYIETLAYGNGILTSDRDFSRWMCGDLATYFEPTQPAAIVDAIQLHMHTQDRTRWTIAARERASRLSSTWPKVAACFAERCAIAASHSTG